MMSIVKTHELITAATIKALHKQMRLNTEELTHASTKKDLMLQEQLETTNKLIANLCEDITENHLPSKIFGLFSVSKNNVIKGAGAAMAALFTTALRQVWNKM